MATAAAQVLPIALTGEYRADGAFRALSRDLLTAKAMGSQAKTEFVSLSTAFDNLGRKSVTLGQNVTVLGRRNGALGGSISQLSFQINDIASGLLMGQSPFQIMAQQGGQVFQVWQMNNNVFKELKTAVTNVLTPGRAMVLGFTAAAGAAYLLYRAVNDNGPTLEQSLSEQARLIGVVKSAYTGAGREAGKFLEQSKAITLLQAQQTELALRLQLSKANSGALSGVSRPTSIDMSEMPVEGITAFDQASREATSSFVPLNRAIREFLSSTQDATSLVKFRDAIAEIGNAAATANPELAKAANDLLEKTKQSAEIAKAILDLASAQRKIKGVGTANDNERLGIKATTNAYQQLIQRTKDRNQELKEEADQAGKTGNAVLALKLQHEAERAAKQAGVKVNQSVLDQLKEELVLRTNLKSAAELQSNITFDREQLGRTPGEADIAQTLRSAKIDLNSAQGEFLAGQIRVVQSLTETRDLSRDALKGFINDMRAGKTAGEAFAGVLDRIANKFLDMAVDNLAAKAFGGSGGAGSSGIGGIFSSIFSSIFGGGGTPLGQGGIGHAAAGGSFGPGDWSVVGEKGAELVRFGSNANVIPNDLSRKMVGGGPIMVRPNVTVINYSNAQVDTSINNDGDLELTVRSLTRDEMASGRTNGINNSKYGQRPRVRAR